ncbi:CDP-alcohol phosphatidyltransferase family protein [bacterium]|nr:CDP-alcohol phosphatidyltransferase family protein [bacterium]
MENNGAERKSKLLFVLVNACTLLNLLMGVAAVFVAPKCLVLAAWLIAASVIFDASDGYLARRWGVSSEFGAQLDSLGDFSSFALGTGVMMYYAIICHGVSPLWGGLAAAAYIVCGAIRLARYNATTDSLCPPEYFMGLPSTAAACILAAIVVFGKCECGLSLAALTAVYGLLMVCTLPYPKLTKMTWVPKWVWAIPFVLAPFCATVVTWVCVATYTLSGAYVWLRRRTGSKRGR